MKSVIDRGGFDCRAAAEAVYGRGMSGSAPSPEGHVVHLLQHWGQAAPPASLRVKRKLGPSARVALVLVLSVAAILCLASIIALWTNPTPGWWFSLLFTVMLGGLCLALWGAYFGAVRSGADRERAAARWTETLGAVRARSGVVSARSVGTTEDGSVSQFTLTVRTEDGATVAGVWRPRTKRPLLQSQVPGVGASARVWSVPAAATTAEPLVIEVLDPTVAADAATSGADKYVD